MLSEKGNVIVQQLVFAFQKHLSDQERELLKDQILWLSTDIGEALEQVDETVIKIQSMSLEKASNEFHNIMLEHKLIVGERCPVTVIGLLYLVLE